MQAEVVKGWGRLKAEPGWLHRVAKLKKSIDYTTVTKFYDNVSTVIGARAPKSH